MRSFQRRVLCACDREEEMHKSHSGWVHPPPIVVTVCGQQGVVCVVVNTAAGYATWPDRH